MNSQSAYTRALSSLEKTLLGGPKEVPMQEEGSLFYQACSFVAEKMGFKLPRPVKENPDIEEISHLAQTRYRSIELLPEWWKQDHGHFVSFKKSDHQPVALIFTRHKEYRMYDPKLGTYELINDQNGPEIAAEGYALYPPFPAEPHKIREILSLIFSRNKWEYSTFILYGLVLTILGFAFPIANKILFDFVIPHYNFSVYTQLFLGLFVIIASSTLFTFNKSLLLVRIKGILTNRLQIGLWDRLLKLPIAFFRSLASGDLLLRTLVFDQIKTRISDSTLSILTSGIFSIAYLVVMLFFSVKLTLMAVALIFIWSLFAFIIILIKIGYEQKLLESNARIESFLIQGIQAINKVRSAVLENRIFAKWARDFSQNQTLLMITLRLRNMIQTSSAFMGVLLPLSFFSFVIYQKSVAENPQEALKTMSVGTFLAFFAAFTPFSQGLLGMVVTAASITEIVPFWRRVQPLLTTPIDNVGKGIDPGILKGKIEVKNLNFRYSSEGALILKGINMKIAPGELIGLVGKSGCGKSTLCRVLFGFEQVHPNTIFYDDIDLTEMDLLKLRKQIGFMFQENKIFNGNIYDNLTCGRPCTEQEIKKAIELSTFDQVLKELPMGLDTRLSTIGGLLSGGQKQKLLLARTFLLDPQILILDEGLNTLDNPTQEIVLSNVRKLNKTTLITTHRLNILESADRIYVIDNSQIVTSGTFKEVSKQEGLFKRFYEQQTMT